MGKKTVNAFTNHVNVIRKEMNFYGIITMYEMDYLYRVYRDNSLSEFKELVRYFIKRKKEEN